MAGQSSRLLPTSFTDDTGLVGYTEIGLADADLASAATSIEYVLRRSDLTAAQRRDFKAALRWARRASRAIGRHVTDNLDG